MRELESILREYPNPEMINDGKTTSPSHRIARIVKGYNRPLYGVELAKEIGLTAIREKCPLFNCWIKEIEDIIILTEF